jgi:uncharacterized membrane protein
MSNPLSQADETALFQAVITPYRSLSRVGLRWLIGGIAILSGFVALRFWFLGAWPVILFSGAEVALAVGMLYLNHRAARAVELVTLHRDRVRIVRTAPSGHRQERVLPSAWLSVLLEELSGRAPRLWLCQRGRQEEIGAVLGEAEKRELADALRDALNELHNPRFDNPQLRQ